MRDWTVRIADGTLRALTEEEFGVRVREAAAELIRDQPDRVRELKNSSVTDGQTLSDRLRSTAVNVFLRYP
ncbi:MAG TPA: hypothetical protein VIS06_09355 [Mycobacteriales bacterium]